jgi:hypothetical protein
MDEGTNGEKHGRIGSGVQGNNLQSPGEATGEGKKKKRNGT